ncbi:hypothetical protein GQE99_07355 [Maritimibacter sp. DP07]|uniref:SGNH hydrolase-type esterase domain-containing protein n=1 Tax=Maritimibacter harenae TaxID=2606218 RepID=A0A845LZS1_9RHOB|nr:hypothetical protein [Maritimibacter harenae]MZR12836.1 hypothetical protein [Maritimibacter harenae]
MIAIGSSGAELFDYIFGDNPDYHPVWAGGWSARGLRHEDHDGYLAMATRTLPRNATVFLTFGGVDAYFIARHFRRGFRLMRDERIIRPAVAGLRNARRVLEQQGFRRIHVVFVGPLPKLPASYWSRFSDAPQLPDQEMGRLYHALVKRTARHMPVIDVFEELSDIANGDYTLRPQYTPARPDHHPDYVKVQDIYWNHLCRLPGILPRRDPPHTALYPHVPAGIGKLKEAGQVRPRTCR